MGRNPDHLDAPIGQDSIKRRGELAGWISDEESKFSDAIAEIHHQVADLLRGPWAIKVGGCAQHVHTSVCDLEDEQYVDPLERPRAVDMEKSQASIVEACVRRNCRQVVSVSRTGAGGIRPRRRTRRMVDAPT